MQRPQNLIAVAKYNLKKMKIFSSLTNQAFFLLQNNAVGKSQSNLILSS